MSSFESLIGKAILSSDPAERQAAEDAVTVKLYASKALRDQSDTVVIEAPGYAPYVLPGAAWDASVAGNPDLPATLAGQNARVLDGRILFAKPARVRKPRVTRADADLTRDAAPAYGCAHMSGYACSGCAGRNA